MSAVTRVVVLGAGFGGVEAMLGLVSRFRHDLAVDLLLVSETNYLMFTPLLPQVASSYVEPRHIVQSVRELRGAGRFRFLRARVTGFDLAARRIESTAGVIAYDYLAVALGSATNFFGVAGAPEHAFTLRSLEDAVVLRDFILDLCEHADHEPDPQRKRHLLTFVVVGGGYTGVELAAELRDLIQRTIVPRYSNIAAGDPRVIVLEATREILTGVDPELARRARQRLVRAGIEVRTEARVARVAPGTVEVAGAPPLSVGAVVWAAGVRANPLLESLPVARDASGRLIVNRHLQLVGYPNVFAIGDNAIVEGVSPERSPRIAPLALAQGRVAAENLARMIKGSGALVSFDFKPLGMLVALGMNDAVVDLGGFKFGGYFAWLFWNAVHLLKLVGVKKQLQVALDWSLATLFPRDTSIVRAPRRCRICHPE